MRHGSNGKARPDREPAVAEVLYDADGERLLVEVDPDLSRDRGLSDALTDILATASDRSLAEMQLQALGDAIGCHVWVEGDGHVQVITLASRPWR